MFEDNDLMDVEGLSYASFLTLMSEVGIDGIKKFTAAKHYISWQGLTPNNIISSGRNFSSKMEKRK